MPARARPGPEPDRPLLSLGRHKVRRAWVNAAGHLRAAHYVVLCEQAIQSFLDDLGFSERAIAENGEAPVLKEMHVSYLREVRAGEMLAVDLQLLAVGEKSAHAFLIVRSPADDARVATVELAIVKIALATRRPARWSPAELATLVALAESHAGVERPAEAGRAIRFEPIAAR